MIRKYSMTPGEPLTEEQKDEIKEAKRHPITFDEDCQELSPTLMKMFRVAVRQRNRNRFNGEYEERYGKKSDIL